MSDKLYCVKAYRLVEKNVVLDQKGYETKVKTYVRKLVVIANDLTYEKAKELSKQHANTGASIFPNVEVNELKVMKLG